MTLFFCVLVVFGGAFEVLSQETRNADALREENQMPKIEGIAKKIWQARQFSELTYYSEIPIPVQRDFAIGGNGKIELTQSREISPSIRILQEQDNGRTTVLWERKPPNRDKLLQAAALYRDALASLKKDLRAGKKSPVPYEFLGIELGAVSDRSPEAEAVMLRIKRGYSAKPSELAAIAYIELALVEKTLGHSDEFAKLVDEALDELKLTKIDFRTDSEFRTHLMPEQNFARPETCLLFLAAETARTGEWFNEAEQLYTRLIEASPACPFAWESLAKLTMLPKINPDKLRKLSDTVVQVYPIVWGCPRPSLKINKDDFSKQLPDLLKKAAPDLILK
jgi:hypothetical protein